MKLDDIPFEVAALLGKSTISLTDYLGLQVGDILILDQPIEKRLILRAGEQELYQATAGLFETHKAVTLDERIYS